MQSSLGHIQINIDFANIQFYRDFMSALGWSVISEWDQGVGFTNNQKSGDLWFLQAPKSEISDFDNRGVNHIGIKVDSVSSVDLIVKFLKDKGLHMLFDTPKHRPEFASSESETYYQVMFKTADNILLEIMYVGPKN